MAANGADDQEWPEDDQGPARIAPLTCCFTLERVTASSLRTSGITEPVAMLAWLAADKPASTESLRRPALSGDVEAKRSEGRCLLLPQVPLSGGRTRAMPPGIGKR